MESRKPDYYDYNDADEVKRAEAINKEANAIITKLGTSMGAPFVYYRPTPINARKLMPQLGEYYELLKKLKRMLDPNRIMNPGHLMDLEPY
jgi:FAD/FMN-containing dehydrogenase